MPVKAKDGNPYKLIRELNSDPFLKVYFQLNHLKHIYRRGWLLRGMEPKQCESIADHLFGVALLTLFLGDEYFKPLDIVKLLKMSLVHEIGEVFVGDMTPRDGISTEDKHMWEKKAMFEILDTVPNRKEYIDLWLEYEEGQSEEAKMLRQIDILEMGLQANVYELQQDIRLEDIITWSDERIFEPRLKNLLRTATKIKNQVKKQAKSDKI